MSNEAIEKSFEKFMQKIFGLQRIARKKTLPETSAIHHNSHNYRVMNGYKPVKRLKQKLLFELEDEKVDWKKEGF